MKKDDWLIDSKDDSWIKTEPMWMKLSYGDREAHTEIMDDLRAWTREKNARASNVGQPQPRDDDPDEHLAKLKRFIDDLPPSPGVERRVYVGPDGPIFQMHGGEFSNPARVVSGFARCHRHSLSSHSEHEDKPDGTENRSA